MNKLSLILALAFIGSAAIAAAAEGVAPSAADAVVNALSSGPQNWTSPDGIDSTLKVALMLTALSLAPAALLMTTCFVRVVVVLSLLRQALGTQNMPPTQVVTALALFITLLVMTPVWTEVHEKAVVPYMQRRIDGGEAWRLGVAPVRRFMAMQIERARNTEDVWLFLGYMPNQPTPASYDEVPLQALLPAFMLSELKTAFLIGFQIFLPFVILDLVVAAATASLGMLMVPPAMISLPLKLLLFVLVDGWRVIVGTVLQSIQAFT